MRAIGIILAGGNSKRTVSYTHLDVYKRQQSKIWGYDFDGETRTVDVHIRTLRQKLGVASSYIETIRGVGYKMEEIG